MPRFDATDLMVEEMRKLDEQMPKSPGFHKAMAYLSGQPLSVVSSTDNEAHPLSRKGQGKKAG